MYAREVVTMVGSMKFYNIMLSEGIRLSKLGYLVLHPFADDDPVIPEERKKIYDENIRRSIDMSSIVYVINVDGYIGKSTKSEMEYAVEHDKKIAYYYKAYNIDTNITKEVIDSIKTYPIITMIGSRRFITTFDTSFKVLSLWGFIVNNPAIFGYDDAVVQSFSSEQHLMLDYLHEAKMRASDAILVVDGPMNRPDCAHIGINTQRELDFCIGLHSLPIYYTTKDGVNEIIKNFRKGGVITKWTGDETFVPATL